MLVINKLPYSSNSNTMRLDLADKIRVFLLVNDIRGSDDRTFSGSDDLTI